MKASHEFDKIWSHVLVWRSTEFSDKQHTRCTRRAIGYGYAVVVTEWRVSASWLAWVARRAMTLQSYLSRVTSTAILLFGVENIFESFTLLPNGTDHQLVGVPSVFL